MPPEKETAATVGGLISGTITDSAGAALPNATVTVVNKASGQTWTVKTDPQGRYQVRLGPGSYSVTIVALRFAEKVFQSVSVSAQQSTVIDARLILMQPQGLTPSVGGPKSAPPPHHDYGGGGAGKVVVVPPPPPPPPPAPAPTPVPAAPHPKPVQQMPGPVQPAQGHNQQIAPASPPQDGVAAEMKAEEDWHKSLPYGLADHHVDPVMRLGQDSPVTFTIRGPDAPAAALAPGDKGGKLQVSPMMAAYLTQTDNPDGFKIVEQDSPQNPKPIAPDGATTWTWIVTPQKLGPLKLHVEAFVLKDDKSSDSFSYQSYDDTVDVHAVTLWGYLMSGLIWVLNNPAASLKWILPGGAGAAMIGKLIHWLVTRKKKPTPEGADDKGSA